MISSPRRRPPIPSPAERAQSIVARGGPATLALAAVNTDPIQVPGTARHTDPDGVISLLIADDHPLAAMTREAPGGLDTLTEMPDVAPVPLREPVRGLLWITGRLTAPSPGEARDRAVHIAGSDPDERLLDLGHGTTMLLLHPDMTTLSDSSGSQAVDLAEFASTRPDPFSRCEAAWLCHLEQDHPDVLHALGRHVPQRLRRGRLRALGLDRYGLRLRVEGPAGDHDIRLAFEKPAEDHHELSVGIRKLVGCPFARRGQFA